MVRDIQLHMIYEKTSDGIKLFIKVSPKASANLIRGVEAVSDNQTAVKILVTAVPEEGKANKAVINLLAKMLKLPKSDMCVIQGETSKVKTLLIKGDQTHIISKIEGMIKP